VPEMLVQRIHFALERKGGRYPMGGKGDATL